MAEVEDIEIPHDAIWDAVEKLGGISTTSGRTVVELWHFATVMHKALVALDSQVDYEDTTSTAHLMLDRLRAAFKTLSE